MRSKLSKRRNESMRRMVGSGKGGEIKGLEAEKG
jgi:hypothetical protein